MPRIAAPNVNTSQLWMPGLTARKSALMKTSFRHKPEWPDRLPQNPFTLFMAQNFPDMAPLQNANGQWLVEDLVNATGSHRMRVDPWDSRLYADAYAKFTNAARDGSAEVGMNAIQYRQTLSMAVKYVNLSFEAARSVKRAFPRAIAFLARNPKTTLTDVRWRRKEALAKASDPTKASYRRVKREIRLLDEITGAFLAYRYGLAPLMADIKSVCDILSRDHNGDVVYRKSSKVGWGISSVTTDRVESFQGIERVVLTGRCLVSNPNLLLANRLGLVNPQQWAWDAIPWSFVVDWWLPVGKFLGNFTASVGLTFVDVSITRTREGVGKINRRHLFSMNPVGYRMVNFGSYRAKRKERTIGSLPMPFSIPYGTGLGVERAQNAVALILQMFSKGVKSARRQDAAEGNT